MSNVLPAVAHLPTFVAADELQRAWVHAHHQRDVAAPVARSPGDDVARSDLERRPGPLGEATGFTSFAARACSITQCRCSTTHWTRARAPRRARSPMVPAPVARRARARCSPSRRAPVTTWAAGSEGLGFGAAHVAQGDLDEAGHAVVAGELAEQAWSLATSWPTATAAAPQAARISGLASPHSGMLVRPGYRTCKNVGILAHQPTEHNDGINSWGRESTHSLKS